MSLAKYGELYRLIELCQPLSENLIKYLFTQLLQGLHDLHKNGIVHRDIKPENLLIDKHLQLVIADFNFAQKLDRVSANTFSP